MQIDRGSVCANVSVGIVISERPQLQNKHCKHSITPTEMQQWLGQHVCMFAELVCMFAELVCMFAKLVCMSGRKIMLPRRGPIAYENRSVFDV